MTCIIGWSNGSTVYLGGDRFLGHSWSYELTSEPKVWKKDNLLYGLAGSKRIMDVVRHRFDAPEDTQKTAMQYLTGPWLSELRKTLSQEGLLKKTDEVESPETNMILGYLGNVYHVSCDLQISSPSSRTLCIGSGGETARGAMEVLPISKNPRGAITRALRAAQSCTPYVREPFDVIQMRQG